MNNTTILGGLIGFGLGLLNFLAVIVLGFIGGLPTGGVGKIWLGAVPLLIIMGILTGFIVGALLSKERIVTREVGQNSGA